MIPNPVKSIVNTEVSFIFFIIIVSFLRSRFWTGQLWINSTIQSSHYYDWLLLHNFGNLLQYSHLLKKQTITIYYLVIYYLLFKKIQTITIYYLVIYDLLFKKIRIITIYYLVIYDLLFKKRQTITIYYLVIYDLLYIYWTSYFLK